MHAGKLRHLMLRFLAPGLHHEIQSESFMAERAFLEARGQLRAEEEAERRTQRGEETTEEEEEKKKDQQEEETDTAACRSPTGKKGAVGGVGGVGHSQPLNSNWITVFVFYLHQ